MTLKLKDLREFVNSMPEDQDDLPVLVQVDPEGNGYYQARGATVEMLTVPGYRPEVESPECSASDMDMDPEEWEQVKATAPRCVVVWP